MEKRNKKNLSRMTMIIAAFLLMTAIGVAAYAATQLTRTASTKVNFSASLGVELTVTAEKYGAEGLEPAETLEFDEFTGAGATDNRMQTATGEFASPFAITDDEYMLYTFKFKLSDTKYTTTDAVPYTITIADYSTFVVTYTTDGTAGSGYSATGTLSKEAYITVVFKVAEPATAKTATADIIFTATFGS